MSSTTVIASFPLSPDIRKKLLSAFVASRTAQMQAEIDDLGVVEFLETIAGNGRTGCFDMTDEQLVGELKGETHASLGLILLRDDETSTR